MANRRKIVEYFPNEGRIRKIGGRLEQDYTRFREVILYMNENVIQLYLFLGIDKEEYTEKVLNYLPKNEAGAGLLYIDLQMEAVEAGRIKAEQILKPLTLKKLNAIPEEETEKRKKFIDREVHRTLVYRVKEALAQFKEEYRGYIDGFHTNSYYSYNSNRKVIEICGKCLKLTPDGLEIDVNKFIEIYTGFLKADESITKEQHQAAADSINKFFNGAFPITQKELDNYFILEDGIVKVRHTSVNLESYSRLGKRIYTVNKK